ncbi:unnamed protein product [Linum trigynum]|uniref:Secreted protein n=1 Tax=Linum trigynum TaxID=586398 RepID=A0AAV2E0Q2_9ROSI
MGRASIVAALLGGWRSTSPPSLHGYIFRSKRPSGFLPPAIVAEVVWKKRWGPEFSEFMGCSWGCGIGSRSKEFYVFVLDGAGWKETE